MSAFYSLDINTTIISLTSSVADSATATTLDIVRATPAPEGTTPPLILDPNGGGNQIPTISATSHVVGGVIFVLLFSIVVLGAGLCAALYCLQRERKKSRNANYNTWRGYTGNYLHGLLPHTHAGVGIR